MLAAVTDDEHWTAAASCADDLRFAADAPAPGDLEELTTVCAACPVTAQCDAYAAEVEAVWGCWAGSWRTPQTLAASRRTAA